MFKFVDPDILWFVEPFSLEHFHRAALRFLYMVDMAGLMGVIWPHGCHSIKRG